MKLDISLIALNHSWWQPNILQNKNNIMREKSTTRGVRVDFSSLSYF